ncbi:MAG: YbaK/EbsC family protein [Sedimenticola sp.]
MGVAITLREYLSDHAASYETIAHPRTASALQTSEVSHVPGDRMVKSVLLGDDDSYVMALIPASHRLDIEHVNDTIGRELDLMPETEVAGAFTDCEVGSIPPVGEAYGIETLVEPCLLDEPEVFFESGDHGVLIRMSGEQFRELLGEAARTEMSHHL